MAKVSSELSRLPLFGCLTGVELQSEQVDVCRGIKFRRNYVDMFGATMLAFSPPENVNTHHPAPWVAVQGGFTFESRVEVSFTDLEEFNNLSPTAMAWLIAAILRLQMMSPVRMAVLAKVPFHQMKEANMRANPVAFERSDQQIGAFKEPIAIMTEQDIDWLRVTLPIAANLYHEERFYRAFSMYDQAQWSPTLEMSVVLIWTAIETLFDLSDRREKTKAISRALSDFIGIDRSDKDRAYQVIQDQYYKRGRVVHIGANVSIDDALQTHQFAKVAFRRVLLDGTLPLVEKLKDEPKKAN